jgi:alpha-amylase
MFSAIIQASAMLSVVGASSYHNSGAIVQLFEWSWEDVANECETFLGPKGYKAAQISPPNEHIEGSEWWTRYQPVSYEFVSRSGDESQFKDMISRCKKANVGIIVDGVINHMAAGSGKSIAGTTYTSRNFPGLFSPEDFHHDSGNTAKNCQVNNYNDKYNVQYCDLVGLPDLDTSSAYVQEKVSEYLNKAYEYGAVGVRVDAAKHQDADELGQLLSKVNKDMIIGQEVIGGDGEAVKPSMYYSLGHVSEFNYAIDLDNQVIPNGQMKNLENFGESWGLMPDEYAVVFLDNHDSQRTGAALTYKNETLYTLASVFMLAHPYGMPKVMSSYYFTNNDAGPPGSGVNSGSNCHDGRNWVCEHRWPEIANMVQWRNLADEASIANWQNGNNGNQIAFTRNSAAFVAINRDNSNWSADLFTDLSEGEYCNVLADIDADNTKSCGETVKVDGNGKAQFEVKSMSAVALHKDAKK